MTGGSKVVAPGQDIVRAYLANRLSEEEARSFEEYCLQHPEFASEVETDLSLMIGMAGLGKQKPAPQPVASSSRRLSWLTALAASFVVLVAGALLYLARPQSSSAALAFVSLSDLPANLQRTPIFHAAVVRLRGNDVHSFVVQPTAGVIELMIYPDAAADQQEYSFRMADESSSGQGSASINNLKPHSDGSVKLYLPAASLIGRTWLITLSPIGTTAPAEQQYRVRFLAGDTTAH
jgi:hypothetical protein